MSEQVKPLTRFYIQVNEIRADEVVYEMGVSYGGNPPMETGKPFWSNRGRPRVIAMLSGDRFEAGPEWKEWRIPLLEFFIETWGVEDAMMDAARAEVTRIQASKEVSHV